MKNTLPGQLAILPDPVHRGKHPLHENRYIVTEGAHWEEGFHPDDWNLENGSAIATMRDCQNQPEARAFDKWWRHAGQNLVPVACEVILHDAALGIAGTTDLIAWSRKTKLLHVLDWKTNAKFERENRYGDFMLPPFGQVPSCQHGSYSVQVGIYRRMARAITGAEFGDSWIIHILGDVLTPHRALELDAELDQALDISGCAYIMTP